MQVWKRLRSPYHRCPACDYWLTATDIYCPNCHTLPRPHQAFLPRKLVLFTASVVAIHGICQGIAQATNPAATLGWELVWRQVLLGAGTWGAVVLGSRWLLKQSLNLEIFPPPPRPAPPNRGWARPPRPPRGGLFGPGPPGGGGGGGGGKISRFKLCLSNQRLPSTTAPQVPAPSKTCRQTSSQPRVAAGLVAWAIPWQMP